MQIILLGSPFLFGGNGRSHFVKIGQTKLSERAKEVG
jgi:hypothetical protein